MLALAILFHDLFD